MVLTVWLGSVTGAWSQDASSRAAAIADREAAEERYRRLNTAVEGLLAAQAEQQRRLEALASELRQLRLDSAKPQGDFVTREQLNQLVESVREVDRKREADQRMILKEIESLARSVTASLQAPPPRRSEPERSTAAAYDEVAEHTVEQGQTLSAIVAAYNAEYKKRGKRTSLKLVQDANPNIKPESIRVGQKVNIPLVPN
ncbi:MAG: LysM peptidoglycan-binding domain-containing protein [Verrucomicrobia bacterium]|nr:LysM peptidoglycan-binding domain-containing protein [Verrucomicrobiota bacterium]